MAIISPVHTRVGTCAGYLRHPFAKSVVFYARMSQVANTMALQRVKLLYTMQDVIAAPRVFSCEIFNKFSDSFSWGYDRCFTALRPELLEHSQTCEASHKNH